MSSGQRFAALEDHARRLLREPVPGAPGAAADLEEKCDIAAATAGGFGNDVAPLSR